MSEVQPDVVDPEPPRHWEADVVIADGGTVHLRPIRPGDAEALVAFHAGLSQRTRYLRYFSAYPRIPEKDLVRFTNVDHHNRVALVAELAGEIIAVGRYESVEGSDEAEVAFVVADAHQGRGIGSVLLEHLAAAARERGLRRFTAVVLAENTGMIRVFRDAGYETTRHIEYGEVTLEFAIDETSVTEAVMREREQRAEARSIGRLLHPRSVAVVGASNDEGKIGNAVFVNLLRSSFDGPLYPVNPDARHVHGVRAYATVHDIPDDIDLVVIAVPAASVPEVVEQCAERGVRGLVVITGGFGERGSATEREAGQAAQRDLVAAARVHGMRVVGPNCLGIVNTDPAVQLNASLAPLPPLAGRAGFFCQSGALGVAVLGEASRRGLGVSSFVSAGNRADVSGNDLLQFWETDPNTDVVLMYLESFGNPRKFARLARRLGRSKPIIAVKSGGAGPVVPGLAYTSVELPEVSVRALFEASGVIRVDTLGDLFDVALLLTSQPLPLGSRVAVVGNSTALGVLVTNALDAEGLRLARMDDVGVEGTPAVFEAALREALADPDVDAAVVVFVPPLQRESSELVAAALRTVAATSDKPVVSTFLGFEGVPASLAATGDSAPPRGSVPSYASPERAVRALSRAVRYSTWRRRAPGVVPALDGVSLNGPRELVHDLLTTSIVGRELTWEECRVLLDGAGITLAATLPPEGVDVVLSLHSDRSFGALVSFGLRGVATELLGDRAYAAVPLTTADATDLIAAPRAAPLLDGYGGGATADRDALAELALRLSLLADALPEITEATLGVTGGPDGAVVTSAQVWIGPSTARPDTGPRRLRGM
ncbi:MAG TPA: GNAT family N-acetyltransferase [Jatrophihabitans sp.]|jgi:acyl-CoA synthetase (NDP forming)/GNAT superfamily N-acetyltransferase|uniref:bifunctional acetate--CoA ligase family protein/GNAT family N-acetyltransferase n=1 Tax=Jatrophihabitans sp. TaxID=1932789 RepID=UPI002DF836E1|nr:GNAT family N-acetyltransferase [Jatrophihabitans sp.]